MLTSCCSYRRIFLCESYSGVNDIESICKQSISALNQRFVISCWIFRSGLKKRRFFLGLIADHFHVDKIKLLKILGPNQIVLVSDAISANGLGD